jgi:hypothetical protein
MNNSDDNVYWDSAHSGICLVMIATTTKVINSIIYLETTGIFMHSMLLLGHADFATHPFQGW